MEDDYNIDELEIIEEPSVVAKLKYTCATCKYEDYSSESPECAWCVDAGPDGGWKTEKGSWEPKVNKMDEVKTFEAVLEKYRQCRDIINVCDLGTEEGWVIYRDEQEKLYLSLDALLGGIPNKRLAAGE